ncbi:serine/threonine protein kinase [Actinoplanes sp. KI2]|uniref:serine/threonine-protein kinase n=1 Tax=Actinoplanes sp. KI2 TaxID=2983315 RepID=UPI0021D5847F|nr:serine/threonine-protein kinase [Actinoplanes sp. KI2]MCU7726896.1 serine/threonine protein kinase [Actinoplanes sp. KI2]
MLTPGVVLSDRYRLTERIAAGGMGEVWRGDDLLLRRPVAIKVLLPTLTADAEFIARFRREARVLAAVRHPGIVQVYDYGENATAGGRRLDYLVMEFIDGTPLSKRIDAAGRLSAAETMTMVAQVADALQVAHDAGIVHRDVKPSNLLVRPGGALVLVDFGVARSTAMEGLTGTNVVLGSAHYMAPEQAEGKPVTAATDVYALGAVAYCCLTGRPPFVGENPLQVLTQLVMSEPPALPADVPPQAAAVVMRALAKDPARRFPSASALAGAARGGSQVPSSGPQGAPGSPARPGTGFAAARPGSGFAAPVASAGRPASGFAAAAVPVPASAPASGFAAAAVPVPASPPVRPIGATPPGGFRPSEFPSSGRGHRRRNAIVAGVVAAVVVAAIGIGTAIALGPGAGQAETGTGSDLGVAGPGGNAAGGTKGNPAGAAPTRKSPRPHPSATVTATVPVLTDPSTDPTGDPSDTPSSAPATNKYTPKELCGGDFAVIDQHALRGADGTLLGRVYLLFNSSTGKNCTVTLKATDLDTATPASAYLEVQGSPRVTDSGSVPSYAGPVRAKADGICVKWGGSIQDATYDSPFEHC